MLLNIPRGIIYHSLRQDFFALFCCFFLKLNKPKIIADFEKLFADYMVRKHCVAFPFARTAIYFSLKAKQISPGSEIIMPPITIKPILDVVLALQLKPVFVDLDKNTLCFDLNKLAESITGNTKAILITYLFGMVPDMDAMMAVCKKNNLFVLEDFSQCLNGEYNGKKVGGFGDVGIYSASSIKTLDTYGGGLLVTDDSAINGQLRQFQSELLNPSRCDLAKKIVTNVIRNLATTRIIFHLFVFPLLKFVKAINPSTLVKHTGERNKNPIQSLPTAWFAKYTSLQARVGIASLSKVNHEDSVRINNANFIRNNTAVDFPKGVDNTRNVFWQTIAYFSEPLKILKFLQKNKIDSSITSLVKISTLPAYPVQGVTPVADMIYSAGLFIPSYPKLKKKDLSHIVKILNSIPAGE